MEFVNFFRPKPGQIVDYRVSRQEYLCWVTRLVYRYDRKKNPHFDHRLEKRFIIGYTKERRELSNADDDIVHFVGEKGLSKQRISDMNSVDFLPIRRPISGSIGMLVILVIGLIMAGTRWIWDRIHDLGVRASFFVHKRKLKNESRIRNDL